MAEISQDMQMRLSGGASNNDPSKSLGGVISSVQVTETLFSDLSPTNAKAGRRVQRQVYVHNGRNTTWKNAVLHIKVNTPNENTDVSVGRGVSGMNGNEPAISTDGTIPSNVQFLSPDAYANGIVIGDIPGLQRYPIWISWFNAPNTPQDPNDFVTFRVDGGYEE